MTVTVGAIQAIEELLVSGRFVSGDRLPVEADLATSLNISRGTLREAVRALAQAGALDVRQGDGSYVARLDPARLFTGLRIQAQLAQASNLAVLMDARSILEPRMAAVAAERRTDADLAALDATLADLNSLDQDDLDHFVDKDLGFHRAVAAAAQSPLLGEVLNCVVMTTVRLRHLVGSDADAYRSATRGSHARLVDALRAGDGAKASVETSDHLSEISRWINMAPVRTVDDSEDGSPLPSGTV